MTRLLRLNCLYICGLLLCCATALGQSTWEYLPGPTSGLTFDCLLADSSGNMELVARLDGAFRSTDDGRSWKSTGLPPIRSVTPLTGVAAGGRWYLFARDSIYESTDRGKTWQTLRYGIYSTSAAYPTVMARLGDSCFLIGAFNIDTAIHRTLYLWRYNTVRREWKDISGDNVDLATSDFADAPAVSTEGIIYTANVYRDAQGITWRVTRTTDLGQSWTTVGRDFPKQGFTGASSASIQPDIKLVAGSRGYLFASAHSISGYPNERKVVVGGFYQTRDSGRNWSHVDIPFPDTSQVLAFGVARDSSGDILVAEPNVVYKSTDEGRSWEAKQIGGMIPVNITVSPGGTIFLTSNLGMFRSTDDGSTWTNFSSGITNAVVAAIVPDWRGSFRAWIRGNSLRSSSDSGTTWSTAGLPFNWPLRWVVSTPSSLIACDSVLFGGDSILYRSDDGVSWDTIRGPKGIRFMSGTLGTDGSLLVGTTRGILRSTDLGESWAPLGVDRWTFGIVVHPSGILVGLVNDGVRQRVYYSSSDGILWTEASGIADSDAIQSITIGDDGTMYGRDHGLYGSTNAGRNWQRITVPFDLSTAVIGAGTNGDIYVALRPSAPGIPRLFRVTERGTAWAPFEDGLEGARVDVIAVDSAGYLYAGTNHHGIARTTKAYPRTATVASDDAGNEHIVLRTSPNPSVGPIRIELQLPCREPVALVVSNLRGERVAIVFDGILAEGLSVVDWAAGRTLPAGNYLVQLVAGGRVVRNQPVTIVR